MLKVLKTTLAVAVTASMGLAGAAFANCQQEGPYEFRQCGITWFAPPPAGSGPVATMWWQVGFGNGSLVNTSTTNAGQDGSAFIPVPITVQPGFFIGNDSGSLNTVDLGLIDASQFGGPTGSLCFGAISNWGSPGIDGCGDVNRNSLVTGAAGSISNQYLNIYWDPAYGPNAGYRYQTGQVDAPMGVMMKEGGGTSFALAFFASRSRNQDETDFSPGDFNVGALINGDPSPTGANVIPWQPVPQPTISAVLSNPADPGSTRNLTVSWTPARFVHDGSTRPCFQIDKSTPCAPFAPGVAGVGVLDQGALIHYDLESTALSGGTCGTTWTRLPGASVDHPANTMNVNGVAGDTCVRLTTRVGRTPAQAFRTTPLTTGTRDLNRLDAQSGKLGDIGYQVESRATKIGSATVSQKATVTVASRNKNMVTVTWETTSELNVTGFDILGIDAKGGVKVVGSKACSQCNNGLGASYTELIPSGTFQGSKKVQVRMQPSGDLSNTLDLK